MMMMMLSILNLEKVLLKNKSSLITGQESPGTLRTLV